MTELEKNRISELVKLYRENFSEGYKKAWDSWCHDRDIVNKKMKLSEAEYYYITEACMYYMVVRYLRAIYGVEKVGDTAFINTKGTTKKIKQIVSFHEAAEKIKAQMPRTFAKFEKEMNKVFKKSKR